MKAINAISPELLQANCLLRQLCQSIECYSAHHKPRSEWDEYDEWMYPIWIDAKRFLDAQEETVNSETEEDK